MVDVWNKLSLGTIYCMVEKYTDYFMVGECARFLFTSCEGLHNE